MRTILPTLIVFPLLCIGQPDFPKCSPNAQKPTWTLQNVTFSEREEYWPDHQNATTRLSFSMKSNVRPFVASCKAATTWTPPNYNAGGWFPCDMSSDALPSDRGQFSFDRKGNVAMEQTYTCWEEAGPTLVRYTASGDGSYTRNCTSNSGTNPKWEEEGTPQKWTDTNCAPVNIEFPASKVSAVA